jgi:putative transposase
MVIRKALWEENLKIGIMSPEYHPWSSAPFHAGEKDEDPLVNDRTLFGLVNDWRNFLSDEFPAMDSSIRKSTRTGRPVGDEEFITLIERLISRNLTKGKPGRPSGKRT